MGTHRLVVDYIVFEFEGHHIFLASLSEDEGGMSAAI